MSFLTQPLGMTGVFLPSLFTAAVSPGSGHLDWVPARALTWEAGSPLGAPEPVGESALSPFRGLHFVVSGGKASLL